MIKTPQLIIGIFIGMLGIAMIIHFWGRLGISAIISDIVGLTLIVVGIITFVQYIRQRNSAKTD